MAAKPVMIKFAIYCAIFLFTSTMFAAEIDQLQKSFINPPDNSRIMMRWWWFGPAVTKPELEREMQLMKEGGIGGFEVQPTYPLELDNEEKGIKNLKFMSPEFLDAISFTAKKAAELGLRMDLTLGSGWPYGGPQFTASEAAGRILSQNVPITAGQKIVPVPRLRDGQRIIAAFVGPVSNTLAGDNPYKEVEIRDNAAQLPTDINGISSVIFIIAGQTGMMVKRPANGAEGYVIDHYNPVVIEKFIREIAEPAVQACGSNPPYAVFCDSLEVGGESWTYNFLEEFKKRCGYDLRPFLPALFADIGPKTLDIRYDWGRTITEIYNDYFSTGFQKFAKEHNTLFRIQGYGTPPAALYSYAYADLGEGEGTQWKNFEETRWASSASHLLGRPVTSSETWTWLHSPVFMATPLDMKAEANLHFLQGINQLIGHGWPYTPPSIEYPGWRFYAAAVFNEKNPWWIVMPDVAKYLQRVSFMMRQGIPANDVALYLANCDAWAQFLPTQASMNSAVSRCLGQDIVRQILESGYNLDFFDDELLEMRGKVDGGTLAFDKVKYKVVILAGVERIPPATMQKLEQFSKASGIVIATRSIPSLAPGFKATEQDQKTVRDIAASLFEGNNPSGIFIRDENQLGRVLSEHLRPDVSFETREPEIGFVHRKVDSAEIYFIANTSNTSKKVNATFRVKGAQPEWWNPMTGHVKPAKVVQTNNDTVTVELELEPFESNIIMFSKDIARRDAVEKNISLPPAIDLGGNWNVTFGKTAKPVVMSNLHSWTEDESTVYFSGVATYEKKFTVLPEMLKDGIALQLDLGKGKPPAAGSDRREGGGGSGMSAAFEAPVREAAVVYVNGQRAGSAWCPPYSVDVTKFLKNGENDIKIEAANLAVNFMSDFEKHPLPDYRQLRAVYGNRFDPQGMNLIRPMPSGLFGPIQLVPVIK